jgi:hypothetical protein
MKIWRNAAAAACLVLVAALGACAPPPTPLTPQQQPSALPPTGDPGSAQGTQPPADQQAPPATPIPFEPTAVEVFPQTPAPVLTLEAPFSEQVPGELIAAMIADLAAITGADPQSVSVVSAQAVIWSDGSLGCPQPGMAYTQALIEGYRVELAAGGLLYDYHAAQGGYFILCGGVEVLYPSGDLPVVTPGTVDR